MANKPIEMSKLRQILKLHTEGYGRKKIAATIGVSKNTVKIYLDSFNKMKTTVDELLKLADVDLNKAFHPPKMEAMSGKLKTLLEFFPEMERNLRKRGVTIAEQFKEYKSKYKDGYESTQFYDYYYQWSKRSKSSMHIEHKAGDKVYVDFAGATLPYVNEDGELLQAQVFVAILGWSQYAYVEAMHSQTVEEFITACENALRFFNGVPLAIVPDNLKSAVTKANRHEPTINENFAAFADYYNIAVLPARSRKPQDKAHVENMVKLSYQRIYSNLSEKDIKPIRDLNEDIWSHLQQHNDTLFTHKNCSRTDQWLLEQSSLQPLPERRYEMRKSKIATVMKNGHIYLNEDRHYYSVPYGLISKKVKVQYSRSQVYIYEHLDLIVTHERIRSPHGYSTLVEHLSPQHQYMTQWNPGYFLEQAKQIDRCVEYYINQVLCKKPHPEQAYKSCEGILRCVKRFGRQRLINACALAHEWGYYNYKTIEDILIKKLDTPQEVEPLRMPEHDNIRGGGYYV